jgi:hypothetical protein
MKSIRTLLTGSLLATSASALAHGGHAPVPGNSLLHLLAHDWPLLLGALTLATIVTLLLRRPDR